MRCYEEVLEKLAAERLVEKEGTKSPVSGNLSKYP
jgi:hypothetical protein